jgi:glycosyltransferase EpsD
MNQEDYMLARKQFYTNGVFKINGVGVNLQRFKPISIAEKIALRNEYNFKNDDFIVICVGQFTHDKNHIFLIKQIPLLAQKIDRLKVLFVGGGDLVLDNIKSIVRKCDLQGVVSFMGYRTDVDKLYALSDILISVSRREGLPQNLVEGMSCGLPVVCSDIRGHVDVVNHSVNGFLFSLKEPGKMNEYIYQLFIGENLRNTISKQNIIDAQQFSVSRSLADMSVIYKQYM